MKLRNRLKLEKFFKEQLWQHLIVVAFVSFCAWLFDKWIEALLFVIAHYKIRPKLNKQFHCSKTFVCLFTTLTIAWFGISKMLPLSISLLSAIPMCFIISYAGFIAQDRMDCISKLKEYEAKTIWKMTEDELRRYCRWCGIKENRADFVVLVVIKNYTYGQIANILGYAESTMWDWSEICKKKLKIKSWKAEEN